MILPIQRIRMNKKIVTLLIFTFSILEVFSQSDTLLPLGINNSLRAFYNSNLDNPNSPYIKKSKTNNKSIVTLPFLDDFSQKGVLPNSDLWEEKDTYINSSFPIEPPTYGVATFDGLDSTGYPYNFFNPTSYGKADQLTSQGIDLSTVSGNVFLSFFYQPQGNGNRPESKDSLRLEFFKKSDSTWNRVWGVTGAPSHPFKLVMLPVDLSFQSDSFKFRFTNYATLSGNVDHWNIDYVYLNDNRNPGDTIFNDVSFITNHHNMLKEFTAMPWDHYTQDSSLNMAQIMPVSYKNNNNNIHNVFYNYEVRDNYGTGSLVETYPTGLLSINVNPGAVSTAPLPVLNSPDNDFYFPPDNEVNKAFEIKNFFRLNGIPDSLQKNDTVTSQQIFGSYYAYDDKSAEVGYGVQGVGSKLAHEFNIKKSDTLTAFQIYFNPITNNVSGKSFKLTVWSSLSPEVIVYQQTSFYFPDYSLTNEFLNYDLDNPLLLAAGTYYFGWEKISPDFLNVGWDLNTNNSDKVHFNALGVWQNASFNGSLMLRPVFGNTGDPEDPNSINDNNGSIINDDFKVYPNPASQRIYFERIGSIDNTSYQVELIDLYGQLIQRTETSIENQLDVSNLSNGIYLIRFINNENFNVITKKIIISK